MTVLADLHTHSTASDGQYAPAALVEKAAAAGIQVLAVTDHDTIDGAEELCRFIHENGVLIIATNGVSATQHRRIAASGLEPWLDKVVVSDDAGAEKPDPRYFERAFAVSGAGNKSECIIIGDSLTSDIRGGQQFGIDTCWFNPKGKALPEDMPAPTYTVSGLSEFIDILNGKDL